MKRSEAAKYARWSAVAALFLTGITGAVFIGRSWQRWMEKKHAPPPPPVNVERQSTALTFSKVEEKRTIFTVEASKSTDFRGENASLLEDVKITVFGESGQRHDVLHTQSCRYSKEKGSISCAGIVQIDLLSAADAASTAGHPDEAAERAVHVETKEVTFDRAEGLATTDQPVTFRFPNGAGRAVGVQYRSDEGTLRLERDVRVNLHPTAEQRKDPRSPQEVEIRGSQLDFARESHFVQLLGPATAESAAARLSAGEFELLLDDDFRAKTLLAKPGGPVDAAAPAGGPDAAISRRPEAVLHANGGEQTLAADLISATFSADGSVQQIRAQGRVRGDSQSPGTKGDWSAETAELVLWPQVNLPRELNLRGDVDLKTETARGGDSRELQTTALHILFSRGKDKERSRVVRAETLSPGSLFWKEATPRGGSPQETQLKADKLSLDFGADGKPRRLDASGNVQTERQMQGKPAQAASAKTGFVDLAPGGGWSQMQLDGGVRLKEGDRNALADHAVFLRAEQTATLTGHASVRDSTTQTAAEKITFFQKTGDVMAEHGVKSTELSAKSSPADLAPAPANITADELRANSQNGHALYTRHARLWQGPAVLEADSIELAREPRSLSANGNVRAVFPQTGAAGKGNQKDAGPPKLWHVSAGRLTYLEKEDRAHLEKDVVIQSGNDRIHGAIVDLYFTHAAPAAAGGGSGDAAAARQISRAVATGGVVVEQGERRATAERGEYTAADGKFVMSGGNPTIFDASSGTTSGRQLTFFLADDTIIVDSENGSRTLTKHRVE